MEMDNNNCSELNNNKPADLNSIAVSEQADSTMLRVHALHALAYCERLYYLENVEQVRIADASVYAGRRLHVELERNEDGEWQSLTLESERLGLRGKVDCLRHRDGSLIPYEHKRGRAARAFSPEAGKSKSPEAWPSDRLQLAAYCMLVEETSGQSILEGRIRYHQDNVTVRVAIDERAREDVLKAIARARELASSVERPPVTSNERLCTRCSLAPACLPEEARLASAVSTLPDESDPEDSSATLPSFTSSPLHPITSSPPHPPLRLFPADDRRQSLHVLTQGARVGRAGDQIEVTAPDEPKHRHPVNEFGQVVLHGFAQITTQALRLCADRDVSVHWITQGGSYIGSFSAGAGPVQKRIRQYEALRDAGFCMELARRLAEARILSQFRFLLRASRDRDRDETGIRSAIESIRRLMPALRRAASVDEIRGVEGRAGALYFGALPSLIDKGIDARLRPEGRSRRPPKDRFNALISFGYALLLKDVTSAILIVGLEPAFGFYHRPRTEAHPLALDLMELFRVAMIDLAVVASINRKQWDAEADFAVTGQQVWLSESGRKKMIEIYERRKSDMWKHPLLGHSLSYGRLIELEARLLEKEWSGERGLFARMRLR